MTTATSRPPPRPRGGFNFWQWLGVALLVVAAAWWAYKRFAAAPPTQGPAPATRPEIDPTRADAGPAGA